MKKYSIVGNKLIIGDKEVVFAHKIKEVIEYNNKYIVLLYDKLGPEQPLNNVYAMNERGKVLWQMQDPKEVYPYRHHSMCIGIGISNEQALFAVTYYGIIYYLDSSNGKILESSSTK